MPDGHIISVGQSNDLGFLNDAPPPYVPTSRVQIWADTNGDGIGDAWNYMRPGFNTGTPGAPNAWGPEVAVANRWLLDHADDTSVLWIVKVAKGSAGLAHDPAWLDWSPASEGEMFDQATAAINAARRNLDGTPYAFETWDVANVVEGETDAMDPSKAAAFGANIRDFITEARVAWNVQEFAVARITDTAGPYSQAVREAIWNLDHGDDPMADVSTFKTIGFGMQPDLIHYSAEGHIAMGEAFYEAWLL